MISKAQAEAAQRLNYSAEIQKAESRIDEAIARGPSCGCYTATFDNLSQPARDAIAGLYRVAGWSVEFTDGDQRDPCVVVRLR